jgi:hypothetical protein
MMNSLDKQTFIRTKAIENQADPNGEKIYWSRHAITEMLNDDLTQAEVEATLVEGEVIEDYPPKHRRLPDCLVLGKLKLYDPLHSVVAIDEPNDRIFMITVYKPSDERWENDWKTRKTN